MSLKRTFVAEIPVVNGQRVLLRGWAQRVRPLAKTTFVVLKDTSGIIQCVGGTEALKGTAFKIEDVLEIEGTVRLESRAKTGFEIDIDRLEVLAPAAHDLPFTSTAKLEDIHPDVILEHRPLSMRHERVEGVFRLQGELLAGYREFLTQRRFTEIISSKIVSSGTEGGTHLFAINYFERTAYLAQSPQFYKEYGVAGFERVFETGHVYRAEPHATSRHLTEYYSLDLEMGFIESAADVIQLERELLTHMFTRVNERCAAILKLFGQAPLPALLAAPTWTFAQCLERLQAAHGRTDLTDDLDGGAERQLCALAEKECGLPAVFVLGFPRAARPFYTAPLAPDSEAAASFDLLFRGLEITTGGQRLHRRGDLEASLRGRGIDPAGFAGHLRLFETGMPPHGGLAIGLERLTAQILGLANVREASLFPRDRNRLSP